MKSAKTSLAHKKKYTWTLIIGSTLAAVGLLLILIFSFAKAFNDGSGVLNANLANNFGGFIGGLVGPIFSLAGFLLLYETIIAQRQSFDKQQESFEIQQFETKFFELIQFHRDNVSQMVHCVPWNKEKNYYDKARVFIEMKSQFLKIFKVVKTKVDISNKISFENKERSAINISYLILFFGTPLVSRADLELYLTKYGYAKDLTDSIIKELYQKKTEYDTKTVYYGGHQVRLGHYFRHLFQTVKFVDKIKFLNEKQKYNYVKILRAQLTQHELAIFFVNSFSIGQEWEKNKYITKYKIDKKFT